MMFKNEDQLNRFINQEASTTKKGKEKGKIKFEFYHDDGVWSIYITQDGKDLHDSMDSRFRILNHKGKNANEKSVNMEYYIQIDSASKFHDLSLIRDLAYDFGSTRPKVKSSKKKGDAIYVSFPIAGEFSEERGMYMRLWSPLKEQKGFKSSKKALQAAKDFVKALALTVLESE